MPEREFELYLNVLSRMLRMSPAQRDALSHELRDHLETRFEDLVRQGRPKEDAIQQVLLEFGDATSVAEQFRELSRRRVRRLVMRTTAVVSTVVILLVLFGLQFSPDSPPLALLQPSVVTAQSDPAAGSTLPAVSDSGLLMNGKVAAALATPVEVSFPDTPLIEVIAYLSERSGLNILPDRRALEDEGVTLDEPVTLHLPAIPSLTDQEQKVLESGTDEEKRVLKLTERLPVLEQVLDRITRERNLDWYVDADILHITSRMVADERMLVRHAGIQQLLSNGIHRERLDRILQSMTPGPWMDSEGTGGSIAAFGSGLSVKQNWRNHLEIAVLLNALEKRQFARLVRFPQQHARAEAALRQTVSVQLMEAPLYEAIPHLSDLAQVRIIVDHLALDDLGISSDAPVSLSLTDVPLETTLDLALREFDLTTIIQDGLLTVTSRDRAAEERYTALYDISRLTTAEGDASDLINAIQTTTSPWMEIDGEGGDIVAPGGGLLLVRQTREAHAGIERLLSFHQKNLPEEGTIASAARLETRFYHLQAETAEDLLTVIPQTIAPETWHSIMYRDAKGTIQKVAIQQYREAAAPSPSPAAKPSQPVKPVQPAVPQTPGTPPPATGTGAATPQNQTSVLIPPAAFVLAQFGGAAAPAAPVSPAGGPGVTVIPHAVLIIHQTPAVHREIDRLLQNLGIAAQGVPATAAGGMGAGGGGFGGGGGGGFFSVP